MSEITLQQPAPLDSQPKRAETHEHAICVLLRCGIYASLALIGLGVLLMLVRGDTGYGPIPEPEALMIPGLNTWPHTLGAVLSGALTARPYALVLTGLLILVATPVLQVVISTVAFLKQRDYAFAVIALFVLGILLLSFVLSSVEGAA